MTVAGQIMHSGVQCIPASETLDRAARLMRELDVGALPIIDDSGRLTGIVTDRDIVVDCLAAGADPAQVTAGQLAKGRPVCADVEADVQEVLDTMERHRIRRLPVLEGRRLVGMISEADIARNLPDRLIAQFVERVYARA